MTDLKKRCPMLPLRELVVFPHSVVPLFVGREKSIASLDEAMKSPSREIFLSVQRSPHTLDPQVEDIEEVGTLSQILQILRLPDQTIKVLVEGKRRARILKSVDADKSLIVEVEVMEEPLGTSSEKEALLRSVKSAFDNYIKLNKKISSENFFSLSSIDDEGKLADTLGAQLTNLKLEEKQTLLKINDPTERLEKVFLLLQSEIEILRIEKKIRSRVKRQMERTQREYYLNEQMSAIQKELGQQDDFRLELVEIETKLAQLELSEEARSRIQKEIKKLRSMNPMSAESTVIRNYVDVALSLPWNRSVPVEFDPQKSSASLDSEHYGLEEVKSRILEYLFVYRNGEKVRPPLLCFLGAPGVGKTSLAKSVAKALNREFVRISLGGLKDEAEIRGHRRTYIAAMPGKIISAMKKVHTNNPVILLDEIDKMSADFRGDPAAALLEVLDQEQNYAFSDHYLDLEYDLSKVVFIATANSLHNVPLPLIDRMEVVQVSGYTDLEKLAIARQHLLPKCLKYVGLEGKRIRFDDDAFLALIHQYTREAGVRNLEREIARTLRKKIKEKIEKNQDLNFQIKRKHLEGLLGPAKFHSPSLQKKEEIGVAQGMAYTLYGGDLLLSEVAILQGKGTLQASGKLGDMMRESAQAALSYIRLRSDLLGLYSNFYSNIDVHIHFPEGAIPKDGPSAGVTIAVALFSALTQRPVRSDIAMTGEISLRGRVLAVGGIKEKLLSAHRAHLKRALIPKANESDLHSIPKEILKDLEISLVEYVDEAILNAILWKEEDFLQHRIQKNLEDQLLGTQSAFLYHNQKNQVRVQPLIGPGK